MKILLTASNDQFLLITPATAGEIPFADPLAVEVVDGTAQRWHKTQAEWLAVQREMKQAAGAPEASQETTGPSASLGAG